MRNTRWALLVALAAALFLMTWDFTPRAASQGKQQKGGVRSSLALNTKAARGARAPDHKPKPVAQDGKLIRSDNVDNNDTDEDPDLPAFMRGRIDKETYLRLRAEHLDLLRGLPNSETAALRAQEIQKLQRQEAQIKQQLKQAGISPLISSTEWTPLGPSPIPNGQTSDVSTPVSGRTVSIAIHPTDPNTLYVGTAQGGLYKSTNGGDNWTKLFDFDLESLAIGAIALSSDANTLYVGTGEPQLSGDSFAGRGLYIVSNANSGTPTLTGPFGQSVFSGRAISKILVHPTDNNTIFVSTTSGIGGNPASIPPSPPSRGVYRSTNALAVSPTFTQLSVTGVIADRNVIDMVFQPADALDPIGTPADPNILLCTLIGAAADGGVYRSTNALALSPTFTRTLVLPDGSTAGRAELAINRIGPVITVLVATGETPTPNLCAGSFGQVRRSLDGGVTFPDIIAGSQGYCGGQCFYDIAIALQPNGAGALLGGSARGTCADVQKRSTGAAFARDDVGLHADTHVNAFAPSNQNIAYTGSDGGIWRSSDAGDNWVSKNNIDYSATQFQDLALHPFDRFFTIGGTQDNGTNCLQPNNTWRRCDFGDGGYALIDQNAPDTTNMTMYHTYFNQRNNIVGYARVFNIAQASDGLWDFRNCGTAPAGNGMRCADNVLFYAPLAIGPDTADSDGVSNTMYYGSDRLYRSNNKGFTMQLVSQGPLVPSTPAGSGEPVTTIGIAPQDDNVRIVGLRNGSVFATVTGSSVLANITSPGFPPPNPADVLLRRIVGRAVVDPNNFNTAYVTFGLFGIGGVNHVFKTTNLTGLVNGSVLPAVGWVASGNGLPDVPVNAFAVDPQDSNTLYAGTDIGVYKSTDGGANWGPFSENLPAVAVFDLEIANAQRIVRIATHGRGIFERTIPGQQLPVIRNANVSLVNESCPPLNGVIDPGERVTVNLSLQNQGPAATSNLVATLQESGGVIAVNPGSQSYGAIAPNGGIGVRSFSFTANGSCGDTITLTFQLTDGSTSFGTVTFSFNLGQTVNTAPAFAENFDDETPPLLPVGWTTIAVLPGGKPWTTTTTFSDTAPNSAATISDVQGDLTACAGGEGGSELTSETIAIPNPPLVGINPSVQLSFRNFYNLEGGFDGGALEISINGGAFQDIITAGGTFVTGGYNGTLGVDPGNPLSGRPAWTGTSGGFITTLVNLPASAYGQNVQFKWRTGNDSCFTPANAGMRIDTISIFGSSLVCNNSCQIPRLVMTNTALSCVGGNVQANVTLQNQGVVTATDVTLTLAQLGSPPVNGTIVPQGPFDIGPGATHTFTVTFATPCPFTGTKLLRIKGTSTNAGVWSSTRTVPSP